MRVEFNGNDVEVQLFDGRADPTYTIEISVENRADGELLAEILGRSYITVGVCGYGE